MPHNYWFFTPTLDRVLFIIIAFCLWTLIGALIMKYFARQVPIRIHAAILFWAALRVQLVAGVLVLLARVLGIPMAAFSGLFGVLALCATGWLVTRQLSRDYGVPTKFPAIGTRVMTMMVIITLMTVVVVIKMTGA
jgi:hypothetical protein